MSERPGRFLAPIVSLLLSTGVFLFTLAPSIYPGDSPEFTAAAHGLGIPHPPGYPHYVVLGKIWTLLPFGNVAFRLNLLSAAATGLSAAVFCRILLLLTGQTVSAVCGALLMAFSRDIFAQSGSAEVYTLNLLCVLMLLLLALEIPPRPPAERKEARDDPRNAALFHGTAFLFGYSLGIHYFVLFALPGIAYLMIRRMGMPDSLRIWGGASVAFLAGWSLFLLLPLRASAHPAVNWGETSDPVNFLLHIGWGQYAGRPSLGFSWSRTALRARDLLLLTGSQWPLPVHLLLPAGLFLLWRRFRSDLLPALLLLLILPAAATLLLLNDPGSEIFFGISSNKFFTLYAAYALLLALGACQASEWIGSLARRIPTPSIGEAATLATGIAVCLLPAWTLHDNYGSSDRSRSTLLSAYTLNLLDPLPVDSGLAVEYDVPTFPLLYLRFVEEYRLDLDLYGRNGLLFRTDYNAAYAEENENARDRIRRNLDNALILRHPGRMFFSNQVAPFAPGGDSPGRPYGLVYRPAGPRAPSNVPDLWGDRFVTSPFRGDPRRLDHRNRELVSDMYRMAAEAEIRGGHLDNASRLLEEALAAAPGYYWIHYYAGGLRYRVWGNTVEAERQLERAAAIIPSESPLGEIGIIRFETGDVPTALRRFREALSINPDHIPSLRNAAECLIALGDSSSAVPYLERALRNDPSAKDAWVRLGQVQGNLGRFREARSSFTKAIEIAPLDGEAHFLRGVASSGAGLREEAEKDFQAAMSLAPERKDFREIISRMRDAKGPR